MEGLVLLVLLALGMGGRNGNGNGNGGTTNGNGGTTDDGYHGPASPGSIPSGNPPGGCRLVYQTPGATVQAMNMIGYTPLPEIWGPDEQLGTFDADEDSEVRQFQLDYNQASRSKWIPNGGGLMPDGLMGQCTMAAIAYAQSRGPVAWRDRYQPRTVIGGLQG